jgi:hypothetical protein
MAVAVTSSPKISPQALKGLLLVTIRRKRHRLLGAGS